MLLALKLPAAKRKVDKELGKVRADIHMKLIPQGPKVVRHLALPQQGKSKEWIVEEMKRMDDESPRTDMWREGKVSGAIYRTCSIPIQWPSILHFLETDGGADVEAVILSALERYCVSNPLHPDVFPGEYHAKGARGLMTEWSSRT